MTAKKSVTKKFSDVCSIWAKADSLELEDAIRLVIGIKPRIEGGSNPNEEMRHKIDLLYAFSVNCAGNSLPLTKSDMDGKLRVSPSCFIKWIDSKQLGDVASDFRKAVDEVQDIRVETQQPKLKANQRHKQRSIAVASMLWEQSPELTIEAMIDRPEIKNHGCENNVYGKETLKRWVREAPHNRAPGRRKTD